jgi:nucleoside-diphosphate-sugar epimerase
MRVLVTGATGFVGRVVLRAFAAAGHDAISVIRVGAPFEGNAVTWDLAKHDPPPVPAKGFSAVVHLAQSRVYRRFPADARPMFDVNVLGAQRVLDFAVAAGAHRFCLVSSGTVYEPFAGRLHEDEPVAPTSYLGASKLAAEAIARPYQELLSLSVLRLFQPYGPGQSDRLVPNLIRRIRSGCAVTVGEGMSGVRLSPTFVDDVAQVIVTGIEEEWRGVFNVAAPVDVSIRDIASTIGRLINIEPVFNNDPRPSLRIIPDLSRLASRYPLTRFVSLEAGLKKTLTSLDFRP